MSGDCSEGAMRLDERMGLRQVRGTVGRGWSLLLLLFSLICETCDDNDRVRIWMIECGGW